MTSSPYDLNDLNSRLQALKEECEYHRGSIERVKSAHVYFTDSTYRPDDQDDYLRIASLLSEIRAFIKDVESDDEALHALYEEALKLEAALLPGNIFAKQHFNAYMQELEAAMMLEKLTGTLQMLEEEALYYIHTVSDNPEMRGLAALQGIHELLQGVLGQYKRAADALTQFVKNEKEYLPSNVDRMLQGISNTHQRLEKAFAHSKDVYDECAKHSDELRDMQEELKVIQALRADPNPPEDEIDKDVRALKNRCTKLQKQLKSLEAKAINTVQKEAVLSLGHTLNEIEHGLKRAPAHRVRRSPVNLPPKEVGAKLSPKVAAIYLDSERRAVQALAQEVQSLPPLVERVRAGLPIAVKQGGVVGFISRMRIEEDGYLSNAAKHDDVRDTYHERLNALKGASMPLVAEGNLPRTLKKKVEHFQGALESLISDAGSIDTKEDARQHMMRLSKAVEAFFKDAKGQFIDWDEVYHEALSALQTSKRLLLASMVPARPRSKALHAIDNAMSKCALRYAEIQTAETNYREQLGGGRTRQQYERACKDLAYIIRETEKAHDRGTITLTDVQSAVFAYFKKVLFQAAAADNPMWVEVEEARHVKAVHAMVDTCSSTEVAIEEAIQGLKECRLQLSEEQARARGVLNAQAAHVKSKPEKAVLLGARGAEHNVLERVSTYVHLVAEREAKLHGLLQKHEAELVALKEEDARLTSTEQKALGFNLSKDIKKREKLSKTHAEWKVPTDFGDDAFLLQKDEAIARVDAELLGLEAFIQEKEVQEYSQDTFKGYLPMLQYAKARIAKDKHAILGAQEEGTYRALLSSMMPWYALKQRIDALLHEQHDGALLSRVQRAALEGMQHKMNAIEQAHHLPSQQELEELGEHCHVTEAEAEGKDIFEELKQLEAQLHNEWDKARADVNRAAGLRRGKANRIKADELRANARTTIVTYQKYLGDFRKAVLRLQFEGSKWNEKLANFDAALHSLEKRANEPTDMQWFLAQCEGFVDGVYALGRKGASALSGWINAGIGYLQIIKAALTGEEVQRVEDVIQDDSPLTPYQIRVVPFLLARIQTGSMFEDDSYHHYLGELKEAKKKLFQMLENGTITPLTFEAQMNKVEDLARELQTACKTALEAAEGALDNTNPDEQLSRKQRVKFEDARKSILAAQQETGLTVHENERAQAHLDALKTLTPHQLRVNRFINTMDKQGDEVKRIEAAVNQFLKVKNRLMKALPSTRNAMGFFSDALSKEELARELQTLDVLSKQIAHMCQDWKAFCEGGGTDDLLNSAQVRALEGIKKMLGRLENMVKLSASDNSRIEKAKLQLMKPNDEEHLGRETQYKKQ